MGGRVQVDLTATVSSELLGQITTSGGTVINSFESVKAIRAKLPLGQMEAIAATYAQGNSPLWRFKFKAQNGLDLEDRMAPVEVAGMLLAVDKYKAKRATLIR